MEERILEAIEYLLMAINDIKDYKDFVTYKSEIIKAINDIKNSIKNPFNINDSEENDKKSKISSILGLQFDYDSLINENDIKFFSDYEDKNSKINNKIDSYITKNNNNNVNNTNKIKPTTINKLIKRHNNKNYYLINPEKTLNCTESLRNKNKLLNNYNSNNNYYKKNKSHSKNININKTPIYNNSYLQNKEKEKLKEKIDIISEIILKMNNENYIYNSLIKIFGNDITDKLLSNDVSDDLVKAVQNAVIDIEKKNKKSKHDKIREKINQLYKQKMNCKEPNEFINNKEFKPKRYKSLNRFKYSEPYKEFNFKNTLRDSSKNYYVRTNTNCNEGEIKSYSKKNKEKNCKKRNDSPFRMTHHQKPFISATCGYGKYFDEPLQKGGISKLDS